MLDLTRRSKCQYGASHAIFYHMTSRLRVWWSHALKTIIHWWIKYVNYVVRLGIDVQKMLHFLMAKSGRFSAKLAYKRRFKSYDKWSLAFVLLCCWIYWGCWGKPLRCVVYLFMCYNIYNICLLHDFVATLRLSALPSALYFVLSKLAL